MSEFHGLRREVLNLLLTGQRFTVYELAARLSKLAAHTAVSAYLRNLRLPRYGGWDVKSGIRSGSTWEYWIERPQQLSFEERTR